VEHRADAEVTQVAGVRPRPPAFPAYNPAFDVTPAEFITAIITEHGGASPSVRLRGAA
jgi:methylthioribose-1-phosphate isomerase